VKPARTHLWYDAAWPIVAGLVTGLGLVAAYRWTGPLMFAVALGVLELTVAPVAWCLFAELGVDVRRIALRVAPATAAAVLAMIGLADAIGGWTFLVVALTLVTSPFLERGRGGGLRDVLTPRAETRRRFDEIVSHAFGTTEEDVPPH
jgi:hypothetical protein